MTRKKSLKKETLEIRNLIILFWFVFFTVLFTCLAIHKAFAYQEAVIFYENNEIYIEGNLTDEERELERQKHLDRFKHYEDQVGEQLERENEFNIEVAKAATVAWIAVAQAPKIYVSSSSGVGDVSNTSTFNPTNTFNPSNTNTLSLTNTSTNTTTSSSSPVSQSCTGSGCINQ